MIENQKYCENMEITEICYMNLHLLDSLGMEFTAC